MMHPTGCRLRCAGHVHVGRFRNVIHRGHGMPAGRRGRGLGLRPPAADTHVTTSRQSGLLTRRANRAMARRLTVIVTLLVSAGGLAAAAIVTDRGSPAAQEQAAPTAPKQRARPLRLPLRRLRGPHNVPGPILMYHVLGRAPSGAI
jgi:hypothetical protein